MRTPSGLYPVDRVVYTCEVQNCPSCQAPLSRCGYRSAFKVVQTLAGTLAVAQEPKRCTSCACSRNGRVVKSAQWLQLAPRGVTYGFDVIAQIGWNRQACNQRFADIHAMLGERIRISNSEVRHLYHERYLPLLACHERQELYRLKAMAEQCGLVLALDGLAPEGGEPQLWMVRELQTGLIVRSGWMSQQDEAAFVSFLQPIADLGLRVAAVLSDKQRGLVPAVVVVFPEVPHAFCQVHYLHNAGASVAEAVEEMKVSLRKDVRESVGPLVRQEKVAEAPGVLTVTGLVPSPLPEEHAGDDPGEQTTQESSTGEAGAVPTPEHEGIVHDILRRVRYLLTLKSRPPFGLAGLEMFERLSEVVECLEQLNAHRPEERLAELQEGLQQALDTARAEYTVLRQAADWLQRISALLDPQGKPRRTGEEVRVALWMLLDEIREQSRPDPRLLAFCENIRKVSASYSSGLFHTYSLPYLPRTNNRCESDFRDLNRRLIRTTGQKGLTRRIIQREGAWELLPRPATLSDTTAALSQVPEEGFREERARVRRHRRRFRLHTRSAKQSSAQLDGLVKRWKALPADTLS